MASHPRYNPTTLDFLLSHFGFSQKQIKTPKHIIKSNIEESISGLAYSLDPFNLNRYINGIQPLRVDRVLKDIITADDVTFLASTLIQDGQFNMFADLISKIATDQTLIKHIKPEQIITVLNKILKSRRDKDSDFDGSVLTAVRLLIDLRQYNDLIPRSHEVPYHELTERLLRYGQVGAYTKLLDSYMDFYPAFITTSHPRHYVISVNMNPEGQSDRIYILFNKIAEKGVSYLYKSDHSRGLASLLTRWQDFETREHALESAVSAIQSMACLSDTPRNKPILYAARAELKSIGFEMNGTINEGDGTEFVAAHNQPAP